VAGDKDNFVHLHNHTEYSMLDGHANVKALVSAAAEMGMPAIAMTDHGNLFGAYDFYKAAKSVGIKPIIGLEGYYMPVGSRFDRGPFQFEAAGSGNIEDGGGSGVGKLNYTHMTMWAETTEGMHNLFKISSKSWLEGLYSKWPRFDRDLLSTYGKGLIATTGCPSGEVQKWLTAGNYDRARKAAADYRDIFGKGNFFVEIMDHGLQIERKVHADLIKLSKDLDIPLIATNDLHYVKASDAQAHDALLCIQTAANISDTNRFRFDAQDFYLKSAAEMRAVWKDYPEACDNTLLIAERCDVKFEEGRNLLPRFDVPKGHDENTFLAEQVRIGLDKRFAESGEVMTQEYIDRAAYELGVIADMRFPGYFLVVADLVRYAKENGIRVGPGRGSAAGALIAWALGITELDPIKHGLLFERFLNPERVSMPDIDMDFDDRRRPDMIRYATEKYGEERVAQIITYSTIKAKAAIKDSARILGKPFSIGDEITKAMPPSVMGKDIPLSGIFDPKNDRYKEAAEFRKLYEDRPDVKEVVDIARGLEGARRQWGVHAAGVILSAEPLMDVIPLIRRASDGAIITQFDMGACEKLGLLKMDFLGLRNLTVLDDCLEHIRLNRGEEVVLERLTLDDPATYSLLQSGETLGVFQLDGGPMRALLRSLAPTSFDDISAVLALYRPGPMGENAHNDYADRKNGRKPVEPIHPELEKALEPILGSTFGVIVYQEQVMAVAQQLAGYTLGQADLLRRAMGKKDAKELDKNFEPFSAGMRERGFGDDAIKRLWEVLVPFADYAFNKSHSAAYGVVSYWTAYLKANYPAEYMAALLTSVKDDRDKLAIYLNECRHMGIRVLPPDVNESRAEFAPVGKDIRFGLTAIKNVGANVVDSIIATRTKKGKFQGFVDFLNKVDLSVCNKRLIESLIKAGAFDSLGQTRRGLMMVHAEAVDSVAVVKRDEAQGMASLFGDPEPSNDLDELTTGHSLVITTDEWEKSQLLSAEREMLGLYVSDHPLAGLEHVLSSLSDASVASVFDDSFPDGSFVKIAGLITSVARRTTKKGQQWATVTLEDLNGAVETMFFPKTYADHYQHLSEDNIVVIEGRIDRREEDTPKLMAQKLTLPDLSRRSGPITITLNINQVNPHTMDDLVALLGQYPGTTEVRVRLINGSRVTVMQVAQELRVNDSPELFGDLKALLGAGCLS
jgi:DNA polymerase-3 subunit alpha